MLCYTECMRANVVDVVDFQSDLPWAQEEQDLKGKMESGVTVAVSA